MKCPRCKDWSEKGLSETCPDCDAQFDAGAIKHRLGLTEPKEPRTAELRIEYEKWLHSRDYSPSVYDVFEAGYELGKSGQDQARREAVEKTDALIAKLKLALEVSRRMNHCRCGTAIKEHLPVPCEACRVFAAVDEALK